MRCYREALADSPEEETARTRLGILTAAAEKKVCLSVCVRGGSCLVGCESECKLLVAACWKNTGLFLPSGRCCVEKHLMLVMCPYNSDSSVHGHLNRPLHGWLLDLCDLKFNVAILINIINGLYCIICFCIVWSNICLDLYFSSIFVHTKCFLICFAVCECLHLGYVCTFVLKCLL